MFKLIISLVFILLSCSVIPLYGQVIVTDLTPDTIVNNNEIFQIDVNQDGIDDFRFIHEDSAAALGLNGNGIGIRILHLDAEFLGGLPVQDPTHYYPYPYSLNTSIDSSAVGDEWVVQHPLTDMIRVLNLQFTTGAYAGQWLNDLEAYLGIRIRINGEWHYGWILMEVAANATQNTIKAFAWQQQAGKKIRAGEGLLFPADQVSQVMALDVADNNDASDIEVSFLKAMNESTISEYRIFVLPIMSSFPNLNTLTANAYHTVIPNGQNIKTRLFASQLDAYYQIIEDSTDYFVYVLSVPDSSSANVSTLSQPSPIFSLINLSTSALTTTDLGMQFIHTDQNITIRSSTNNILKMNLYTIDGKRIQKYMVDANEVIIQRGRYSAGIYIISIQTSTGIINRKIII